jgi:hypothetical protein
VVTHGVARFRFRGSCDPWQGKSELPKKKRELPNKSGEMRGYWAKPPLWLKCTSHEALILWRDRAATQEKNQTYSLA